MIPSANLHQNQPVNSVGFARPGFQSDFPLRILVRSDMVGAIIGRSGGTIRQITQQSKARIDVHREESLDHQEKVITINGSQESCSSACFRIMEVILSEKSQPSEENSSNNIDNPESAKQDTESFSEVQLKILAHNNLIGRLIGRNGASIKKIMEQTNTRINISVNVLTDCTNERTITVMGNLDQVRQAEKLISTKLRAAYLSDVNITLQALNQQPFLFNNVPMPYMAGPYAQNQILSSLVNPPTTHAGHQMARSMPVGSHQNQLAGPQLYAGSPSYLSLYSNIGVPSPGPGLFGFKPSSGSSTEVEREIVHVCIPNSMVGAIIGKSGSAIKDMISQSGASIKVAAPSSSDQTQVVQNANNSGSSKVKEEDVATERQTDTTNVDEEDDGTSGSDGGEGAEVCRASNSGMTPPHGSKQPADRAIDDHPPMRKVTIVGSPESQWTAQYLIYRKVSIENGKSDISLMVEIQIPSQFVGKIIGKGGVTVKNLQKHTRTTIRLSEERTSLTDNERGTETCVQITGEFQNSQLAQRHIRNLIRESLGASARQNKSMQSKQDETKSGGTSDAQPVHDDDEHRSGTETIPTAGEDYDKMLESNEKNMDNLTFQSDGNPSQDESPSISDATRETPQEVKSQPTFEKSCTNDAEQAAEVNSNNNIVGESTDKLSVGQQFSSEGGDQVVEDTVNNNQNDSYNDCQVQAATNVTPCAKHQHAVESLRSEPALINDEDPK